MYYKLFFQPTMAEGGEDIDLVKDIVKTPFSRRTFQEKLDIVRRGRPKIICFLSFIFSE